MIHYAIFTNCYATYWNATVYDSNDPGPIKYQAFHCCWWWKMWVAPGQGQILRTINRGWFQENHLLLLPRHLWQSDAFAAESEQARCAIWEKMHWSLDGAWKKGWKGEKDSYEGLTSKPRIFASPWSPWSRAVCSSISRAEQAKRCMGWVLQYRCRTTKFLWPWVFASFCFGSLTLFCHYIWVQYFLTVALLGVCPTLYPCAVLTFRI